MLIWRPGDAGIINILEKSLCRGFDFGIFVTMVEFDYGLYALDRDSWLTQRGKWGLGRAPRGSFSKVIVAAKNTGILARPSVGGPKAISSVLGFGGNCIHHPAKKIQHSRDLCTFIADVISSASSKVVAAFAERREEKLYTTFRGFEQTLRQLFREIANTNGNTVNIAARKSVINISLLLHLIAKLNSFRSFCIVSRLCPINKLAHLLFGTPKIPIHAHPRLCIGLSCTTLLKAVYRGGKTTPTTGGGSNEFRNDDEPNTTKRRPKVTWRVQHQSSSESHGQSNSSLAKGKRKLDKYITILVAKSSTTEEYARGREIGEFDILVPKVKKIKSCFDLNLPLDEAEESESDTVSDTKDVWLERISTAYGMRTWEKQGGVSGTMVKLAVVQGVTIEEDDALYYCLPSRIIIGCSRRYDQTTPVVV
ncbi:hypothetical protein Tco_1502943 [Tanacetum coccineum]